MRPLKRNILSLDSHKPQRNLNMISLPTILFLCVCAASAHPPGEHEDALNQTRIQSTGAHDHNSIHVWHDRLRVKMVMRMISHLRRRMVKDLRATIDLARAKINPPHPHLARATRFHFQVQVWARMVCLMQSSPATAKACPHHSSGAIYQWELKVWR